MKNGLAFSHYIDRPWLIFHLWHSEQIHEKLRNSVEDAIAARRSIDGLTVARLRWYPALVGELIMRSKIARPDIDRILNNPVTRFYALASHYTELAPTLETGLLNDPEAIERLLTWLRLKRLTPFREENEYTALLGDDPNRHYRLTPPQSRPSSDVVRAEAAQNKYRSAAWAYLWVSCTQDPLLDKELISVLKTNEEYAYLAAFVLRYRNYNFTHWVELVADIKSPRWAFHVLRDIEPGSEMPAAVTSRILRRVHSSPPWAVQLWETRGWKGEQLRLAAHECDTLSLGHECEIELNAWLRLARLNEGTRVAFAAA